MNSSDNYEAAQQAIKKFNDPRVKQFYDSQRLLGRTIAKSLGHCDELAWDIYLFYPPQAVWQELPPPPELYMHQLRNSWADQSCLFEDDLLRAKLTETMKLIFS